MISLSTINAVRPVNERTELVSGMPEPQSREESSRVTGSELVQGSRSF
jgi:hypothetical protein